MKIIITENQKKKLFIPRDIDGRDDKLKRDIEKFLVSIKDNIVWDIIGGVYYSYGHETGWEDISYYSHSGLYIHDVDALIKKEDNWETLRKEFNKEVDKITDFMKAMSEIKNDVDNQEVIYVYNTIKYEKNH